MDHKPKADKPKAIAEVIKSIMGVVDVFCCEPVIMDIEEYLEEMNAQQFLREAFPFTHAQIAENVQRRRELELFRRLIELIKARAAVRAGAFETAIEQAKIDTLYHMFGYDE